MFRRCIAFFDRRPVGFKVSLNIESWFAVACLVTAFLRARRVHAKLSWTASRIDALAMATVAIVIIGCFAWTARSYFLADDFTLLVQAHAPFSWRAVFATRGGDGSFRPFGHLSYMISAKWASTNPAAWHWIGYGLHAANAMLVYALAAALGYSRVTAWLAAAIFALHGAHPEAVVWMAGRFDLLSTLFVLLAALAFVRSWGAVGGRQVLYQAVAVASLATGLLSKESAYSFPLVAALLAICFVAPKRSWALLALFFLVAGALFAYRWNLLGGIGGYGAISLLPSLKALAFRMWAILFFPVNWTLQPGRWLWIALAVYVVVLVRLFAVRAEMRRLVFAAGFVILTAAPAVSQLLIGADLEKSRVLYMPSVGFCLLLAALFEPLRLGERAVWAPALLFFHGIALWHNLAGWRAASEVVQSGCAVAAQCAESRGQRIFVTDLPRTLHGVYTFANGFPECVAMQRGGRPVEVKLLANESAAGGECTLAWDSSANALRVVH
jgi:hypothetical protein